VAVQPYIRLDSSAGESRWGHEPAPAQLILRCASRTQVTTLSDHSGDLRTWANPLEALSWMQAMLREAEGGARWIGYLSYDLGRLFESLPSRAAEALGLPLFLFTLHQRVGRSLAVSRPERGESHLGTSDSLRSNFTRQRYESAVKRVVDYIVAGDIFQANLSQCFTAALADTPLAIAERLRGQSPAIYGAFLDYGDHALICNSPELFLRVTPQGDGRRKIITRPIKGTRPRLPGMDATLRDSIKDQAELNMIVDLERNDLGRVCEIGSVKVTQPREIEAHPTVYHGVATIEGTLRSDVTFVDLLRATFPGGSITGAPKIRAMEIIDELEPTRRGPYCGAIGYLAADGSMEFNIAIRTMIVKDGLVHVPVGGGIVADSDPAEEYEETLVKARAMFAALGVSVEDFRNPGH
jgi:anthranilate/para-aminobenzoate synthase component I